MDIEDVASLLKVIEGLDSRLRSRGTEDFLTKRRAWAMMLRDVEYQEAEQAVLHHYSHPEIDSIDVGRVRARVVDLRRAGARALRAVPDVEPSVEIPFDFPERVVLFERLGADSAAWPETDVELAWLEMLTLTTGPGGDCRWAGDCECDHLSCLDGWICHQVPNVAPRRCDECERARPGNGVTEELSRTDPKDER